MKPLSVYVHIPFCLRKCSYCDFPSFPAPMPLISDYLEALKVEIELYREFLSLREVETIYFGGGTPSIINSEDLLSLLDLIIPEKQRENKEITLEANPGTVNFLSLKELRDGGFNRISLGVQSFLDSELSLLERIHTSKQAFEAFEMAREAGFSNINLDLIFGLPGQNLGDFLPSLEAAVKLAPEHLSLYCLSLEKGTRLWTRVQSGELDSPSDETVARMYQKACQAMSLNSYEHYEISNFARSGYRSRHNQVYWHYGEYIGFGLEAVSFHDGIRRGNTGKIEQYIARARERKSPVSYQTGKKGASALQEEAVLHLRTSDGFREDELAQKYPEAFPAFKKKLEDLREKGLLLENNGQWHIREEHFFVSLEIMAQLL